MSEKALFPSSFAKPFIGSTAYRLSAIRRFPFLAAKHSPSCRQRKRSLGFARDDDTGRTRFPHILCMMHGVFILHTIISSAARNLFRFPFPSSFAKPFRGNTVPAFPAIQCFPFLAVGHAPSYRQRKRSLDFARDDVAEVAFSQHTLYTGRGLSIPPYRHFERSREIFLALCSFLLPSQKVSHFPLSHIRRYTDVQERSLHFGRDDNEDGALLSLFSCRHAKECLFEAH